MRKKGKIIITAGCIFCFLCICYIGVSLYFYRVFYPNTFINGMDVSGQDPSEVRKLMEESLKDYEITVVSVDSEEVIKGSEFDFEYEYTSVEELKKEEQGWQWPLKMFRKTDYQVSPDAKWNQAKLDEKVNQLLCMTQEMTAPKDASLTINEEGFHLTEEVVGNTVKKDKVEEAVTKTVTSGETKLILDEEGCYEKPQVTVNSPEIQDQLKKVDELCNAEVVYDFHGNEEKIGKDQIRKWVRKDDDGELYVSWEAAYDYLDSLVDKYDTVNSYRTFQSSRGYEITLEPGSYGWGTDVSEETDLLIDDIKNHRVTSRQPAYYMTPYDYLDPNSPDDIGFTYIEIDLSGQYLWYYKDGSLFLSTPITSGTMSTGHGTPSGVYYIHNRLQNTILVGDDYRQPVDFWMQVVGGVGIHDSKWRYNYGGTEYLNNGSHGCINTPYDAVQSLFWNVEVGTPVIMYY